MEADHLESFNDGFIEPTLIKQLQNILKQYPDDGQILKELIQNAEDAGAKTVKFLYDHNQYPREGEFHHKGLAAYQGPALYAYNDAVFSNDDWKGIRMIQDSVKAKDPMKVGRFGLGFKSVFHMTDLPGIISGKQVGFLDPRQLFFKKTKTVKLDDGKSEEFPTETSSYAWKLSADLLSKYPNQFKPFMHDIFNTNEEAFESGNFKGTVFRFPLRKIKGDISKTIYNDEKISNLMELLEKEGDLLLLFLKHLERIEFLELFPGNRNPELKLSVAVSSSKANIALEIRQDFVDKIQQKQQQESEVTKAEFCNYLLETKLYNSSLDLCEPEPKRWAVTQYYGAGDVQNDISGLASKSQNIPLVGVALPLDANVTAQPAPSGSVFCFLPMPLESDNETGLNVHVNGYFAVDHNRRHLKWPAKDQSLEHSTDEDLMWNNSLLKYVIPRAMNELLQYAIAQDIISDEQVYAIFPSKATLKDQWLPLLEMFKEKAEETTCLYSTSTEMWIKPREAYLISRKDAQFQDTIKALLINGKIPFCEPPCHVIDMLQESMKNVTPEMIRVQVTNQVAKLTKLQKQDMIQYFYLNNTVHLMMDLELVQLLDGTYRKFEEKTQDNVLYLETEKCPRNVFPTVNGKVLPLVNYNPSDDMYEILQNIARSGKTQLTILEPNNVPRILQDMFQDIETYTPNLPQEWLKELWSFIDKFNMNLAEFIGIPMIPLTSQEWGSLSTSIPYIVDKSTERSLSDVKLSSQILEKIGCKVVKEWNNVAGRISWEKIGCYVSPPTIKGMLDALMKVEPNGVFLDKINNLAENDKIRLRDAIDNDKLELEPCQKTFLEGLHLIKCYKSKGNLNESWCTFSSIECFADLDDYNIPLHYQIGKWKENKGFATILGAVDISQTVVLKKYIFPTLNEQFYNQECIQAVMETILQNLHQHKLHDPNFLQDVGKIPFLTTRDKKLIKPCEVMDPSDEILKDLFQVLDVFPCDKFSDPEIMVKLHGIFRKVSEHDVYELVKYLNNSVKITTQMCEQGEKLLQFLNNKGVNFESSDTYSQIGKMKWLPAKVDRPNYYPEKVSWYGNENVLYSPDDIFSAEYENIVGSVKPVLVRSLKGLNPGLVDGLKLNKFPSTECIVSHLEKIQAVHTQFEKKDKPRVTMMIKEIYQKLNNMPFPEVHRLLTNIGSWVWNGETFTIGEHVVLEKAAVDTNPYVSCLPQEYAELSAFFLKLNIQQTVKLTDVLMMINDYHKKKLATVEETNRDLKKCLEILLALKDSEYEIPEHTPLPILVSDDTLEMASLENCAYCDQEMWKKKIDVDDVRDSLGEGENLYVVHDIIPPLIAKSIGVSSLTSKYLHAEPISYGQSEPLTRRLNRLLDDYKDGTSVLKELLQNADDAGATKVAFIYDRRDFRSSSTFLIDKNMKELQGPALLCYNDAQFTDEDFENIVKLSGETKKKKLDKVGRFGLGFNAVYNLTDSPSFISNHSVVILDPHVKYLGDAVKDASQPGIRLQFTKHGKRIRRFKDQFKPFENIMGIDIQNSQHYSGTLFRLPLRTPEQAQQSLISSKSYEWKDIQELFALFQTNAKNMLLFTQNVIEIDFYEIPEGCQQPVPCGHIHKSLVHLLHSVNSSPYKCDWSDELQILKHAHKVLTNDTPKRSSYIMKTEVELNTGELFATGSSEINHWLISAVVGNGESRKSAREQRDLLPVGGIAVELKQEIENKYHPLLSECKFDGQVFCFLPLPIKNELPFHINGYFAVESNRRQLSAQQFSEKSDSRAYWNEVLIKDAVKEAFVEALHDMVSNKTLFPLLKEYILELFPLSVQDKFEGKINNIFTFTESFYRSMCETPLDILPSISTWMSFSEIKVLSPGLRNIFSKDLGHIGDMIFATCENYFAKQSKYGFVDLPRKVLDQMLSVDDIREVVESKIITLEYFYSSILLDSETELQDENFHRLIVYGLLECENKVDSILRENQCIPVAGNNGYLKPTALVDPYGPLQDLYDEDSNPFPVWLMEENKIMTGIHANMTPRVRLALQNLGMRILTLPEDEIICRAKTIQFLSKEIGTKRCKCVLQLLKNMLTGKHTHDHFFEDMKQVLYLPIAEKSQSWNLPWKNDQYDGKFMLIDAAYSESQSELIGCSEFVAGFPLSDSYDLQKCLSYGKKEITFSQIDKQLHCIVPIVKDLGSQLLGGIERVMDKIYQYFDSKAKEPTFRAYINENYQKKELIMIQYSGRKGFRKTDARLLFVTSQQCVQDRFDGEPYLFSLPHNISRYRSLVAALKIKDTFPVESLIQALKNIAQEENQLLENGDTITIVRNIVAMLAQKFTLESSTSFDMYGTVFLPDSKCVMTSSVNLCFNNCPWVKSHDKHFLHPLIPFEEAEILGVKTFRKEMLRKFQSGIPFGQSEKLVNRIKRILEGYPCDKEIMNELLQNADDSGATEVHFILDPRKHPDEKLFEPMWKPLQGPALLVYNDQPFTEKDLEGIKNLGEGSKSNDPLTTGKYGVGFNCVYHLTDTPTFLTTVKEEGKTLVAFDPQCKYVPGSEPLNPGQRWNNVEELQQTFPDVFRCYQLPFETEGGTLFRFPLRQEGTNSDISDNSMSVDKIGELFKTFSESIAESLLFINNVQKVTLSTLNPDGSMETVDKVELNMNVESQQRKVMFLEKVKLAAQAVTVGSVENIQPTITSYQVDIEHQSDVNNWLVVQQIGFESQSDYSDILKQYKKKKATMLPRGGVAYLLSTPKTIRNKVNKDATATTIMNTDNSHEQEHRLFCFLPLPVKIQYPMHVNGYFVLDHETRRNLWYDDKEIGLNVIWNKLIMQKVVAPCYNKVMEYVKENIATEGKLQDLKVKLQVLIDIFPHRSQEGFYMNCLEKSIFEHMMVQKTELLPVLLWRSIWKLHETEPQSKIVDLLWYPLCSDENRIAYFDNLKTQLYDKVIVVDSQKREQQQKEIKEQMQYIRNVLQNCRFPITLANDTVLRKIKEFASESDQTPEHISPENVLKFLILKCEDFRLPIDVRQSVFVSRRALTCIFSFVKEHLHNNLENVPLLLKADGVVHMFKTGQTCLLSDYSDLMDSRLDLFAHKLYLFCSIKGIDAYQKPLTCENLAQILEDQLPKLKFYGKNKTIPLDSQNERFIRWLVRLWAFIHSQFNDDKSDDQRVSFMQKIKPLEEWCILPVKRNSGELWPLCHILQLVNLQSGGGRDEHLSKMLKRISFPQVSIPFIQHANYDLQAMIKIIDKVVSNLSEPDRVLVAFGHANAENHIDFLKLTATEGGQILKYFSDVTMLAKSVPDAKSILMNLPLYETQSGDMLSVSNIHVNYYTMPHSIPSLKGWTPTSQNVYLKPHSSLLDLHKFVGIIHLNEVEAYLHHILDYFLLLNDEIRDEHLYFLKGLIEKPKLDLDSRHEQLLLEKMKNTPMLRSINCDILLTASEFYDDMIPLFKTFESNFPISPYNRLEWKSFLHKIGLVHKLNGELLLKYAKIIEEKALSLRSSQDLHKKAREDLHKKAKLLYETITENQYYKNGTLHQIAPSLKKIAFIPNEHLSDNLVHLCGSHTKNDKFVKLDQSTLSENAEVQWTQCSILISWVNPSNDICKLVGIKQKLTLQEIVNNLKAVIDFQIEMKITHSNVSQKIICFLQETFRRIMQYHKGENVSALTNIRCIAVNKGTQLVYPTQTTIYIPCKEISEHVTQYLCKIPLEYLEYQTLLLKIGATENPTVQQYANVLKDIYGRIENETPLAGNEMFAAVYALKGLFQLANVDNSDINSISDLDQLHLLSDKNHLVCSQKLVFIDTPRLEQRIGEMDVSFFSSEEKMGQIQVVEKALRMLKSEIQPVFLSKIINECVDAPSEKLEKTMKCEDWEERLASKEFANGIIRIMRSSENEQGFNRTEEDDARDIKLVEKLGIIKVYELDKVNTYLVHNGDRLPKSDAELPYFIQYEAEEIRILLTAGSLASKSSSLCRTMSLIINKLLEYKIKGESAITLLILILDCPVEDIEDVLDEENVIPYEIYTDMQRIKSNLPTPGQYIPLEFHHLLQQSIELLNVGEYIAFEVYDSLDAKIGEEIETDVDGDNENAVYRYARVTQVLTTEGGSYCNYYYEIDLGYDEDEKVKVKVHASKLYRFERKPKTSGPVVVSTQAGEDVPDVSNVPRAKGNLSQIKSQITETLEEAWKLEDEVKRRMIKRLCLQWHPDKNLDCIEMATEVFKFIQNEIERLEKGLGRSEVNGANRSNGGGGGFSGFNFNNFFRRRARSHRHHRDNFEKSYREHSSRGSSHYTPPRYKGKNPQPDEAKKWMKQAQYDLLAVRNDLGSHFNEWACFKAHQAAEKALKATQLAVDSRLKDNQHALASLCNAVLDQECITWASELECLVKSSAAMINPDRHYGGQTPHDAYSDSTAQAVKTLASQILEKCQDYIKSLQGH